MTRKPLLGGGLNPFPSVITNQMKNPSLEIGAIVGWYSNNAGLYPVTVDTTSPISGQFSVMSTRLAATLNTTVGGPYLTGTLTGAFFPVTPGQTLIGAVDIRAERSGRNFSVTLLFRDSGNVAAGSGPTVTASNVPAGQVRRQVTVPTVVPANAVTCYINISIVTADASLAVVGERVWFDNGYLGTDPTGTYVDGDMPGYFWEGGRTQSNTRKYGQPIAAARNVIPSPYDPGAVGAATTKWGTYTSSANSLSLTVAPVTRNGRPVHRATTLGTVWTAKPNLVTAGVNGTFEGNISAWSAGGTPVPTLALDATRGHTGTSSLKCTYAAAAAGTGVAASVSGLTIGQAYIVEGWLYVPSGSIVAAPTVRMSGSFTTLSLNNPVTTPDTWVYSSSNFVATATTHTVFVASTGATTAGMISYVDDVKLYAVQNLCVQGENGTFERGSLAGWAGGGTVPTIAADATRAHGGTGSMKITWPVASSNSSVVTTTMVGLVVSTIYTAEAWLYIPTGGVDASIQVNGATFQGNIITVRDQWALSTVTFAATATSHTVRIGTRAASTAGQVCYVDDVQFYLSAATNRIGIRPTNNVNIPTLPAGTRFVASCEMYLSADAAALAPPSIQCILRDDPNNDSNAATFDTGTPSLVVLQPIANQWVRYSWVGTVNAGRNVTGVYFVQNFSAYIQNAGVVVDFASMMAQAEGEVGTEPYFDGGSVGCSWAGATDASISTRRIQNSPYNQWDGTQEIALSVAGLFDGTGIQPTIFAEVEVV